MLIFIILNLYSYVIEVTAYEESLLGPIRLSHTSYEFGFPLALYRGGTCFPCNDFGVLTFGLAVDVIIASALAGIVGILFTIISDRARLE